MAIELDVATVDAMLTAIRDRIDGAGKAGSLTIYAGSRDAPVILGKLSLGYPCAASAAGGQLVFNEIAEDPMAATDGKATFARISDGDGRRIFDCSVSDKNGRGLVKLNTTAIKAGGPIRVGNFVIRQ